MCRIDPEHFSIWENLNHKGYSARKTKRHQTQCQLTHIYIYIMEKASKGLQFSVKGEKGRFAVKIISFVKKRGSLQSQGLLNKR